MTIRNDDIEELLHDADARAQPRLPPPAEMARRVRIADRRGRQRRTVLSSAIVLLLMSATVTWYVRSPKLAQPVVVAAHATVVDRGLLANELDALAEEAAMHARLARRMVDDRKKEIAATLRRRVRRAADPIDEVRERMEIVAYRMIYDAEQLEAARRPPAETIVIYRDVIRLFPHTRSAELARQRLASLGDS